LIYSKRHQPFKIFWAENKVCRLWLLQSCALYFSPGHSFKIILYSI
jgi:hypothetical protein